MWYTAISEGKPTEEAKIQWHMAFVSVMDLELAQNRFDLAYHKEYNLNRKVLEVDFLIIKKDSGIEIANEIGKLFRGHMWLKALSGGMEK